MQAVITTAYMARGLTNRVDGIHVGQRLCRWLEGHKYKRTNKFFEDVRLRMKSMLLSRAVSPVAPHRKAVSKALSAPPSTISAWACSTSPCATACIRIWFAIGFVSPFPGEGGLRQRPATQGTLQCPCLCVLGGQMIVQNVHCCMMTTIA